MSCCEPGTYSLLSGFNVFFEVSNVFLQTGSGKTYTMMGEIYEIDGELNEDCGITPRIFEYLFTRIRAVGYLTFTSSSTE